MTALDRAQGGDPLAFEELVEPHRRELQAHCYRMLGSIQDAEDACQEALVAAWRGLAGFEGRSSLRAWLYRIATNTCLRLARGRRPRLLSWDHAPAWTSTEDLGAPVAGDIFLDPWPQPRPPETADPAEAAASREGVELAFVAALQTLPPNQRAVLILRDVLVFSAAEVAGLLDTSVASVNSALQRARAGLEAASPQRDSMRLPEAEEQALVTALVAAWERGDVDGVVALLAREVRFTMPPLPAWFDGRASVERFLRERVFQTPWRFVLTRANGRPAMAGYQGSPGTKEFHGPGSVTVVHASPAGVVWLASFLDPGALARFEIPAQPFE